MNVKHHLALALFSCLLIVTATSNMAICQAKQTSPSPLLSKPLPLISAYDDRSPSLALYFDWINRNWYGSNEQKVLKDLDFFNWMKTRYGMQLDIFLLDAGMFDNGPHCSSVPNRPAYGDLSSPWFTRAFPHGFRTIAKKAALSGIRLGLWIGPDGYGNTPEEAEKRIALLVDLCRDYKLRLFKMDACCSDLRPDKELWFSRAMQEARRYSPDLVVLNHRISLSEPARKYTTTFLWEGKETYIDVNNFNDIPATHHREGNMRRGYPPHLQRLTEDHGICLSSALDNWEDDLVLQAFGRSLILAPEIYGNPWLLKDKEFPLLARIYNLHRQYNGILVDARELPEEKYGFKALSRGDDHTRFIILRNLSWNTVSYDLPLDSSIGLNLNAPPGRHSTLQKADPRVTVRQFHPTEKILGSYSSGSTVSVEVSPFRSALFMVSAEDTGFGLQGIDYRVVRDIPGKPLILTLLGQPGSRHLVKLRPGKRRFSDARLDNKPAGLLPDKRMIVHFAGSVLQEPFHRKLGDLAAIPVPEDAALIYETQCYRNDNNALELRSLERAGTTQFPEVQAARDAFFRDSIFISQGVWDRFAFDGEPNTAFKAYATEYTKGRISPGALRLDMGKPRLADRIVFRSVSTGYPADTAEASNDLSHWKSVKTDKIGKDLVISLPATTANRYIRLSNAPVSVSEIEAYDHDQLLPRQGWTASNLFPYRLSEGLSAWQLFFTINEITPGSYLVLSVPGNYITDKVFAGLRMGDRILAPTDRSPSFAYNNWEDVNTVQGNASFYFPVTAGMRGKKLEMVLVNTDKEATIGRPECWITSHEGGLVERTLVLEGAP